MKLTVYSSFCIALLLLFGGCKKNEDTQAPVIVITAPQAGSTYYYEDFITAGAQVTDNKNIASIKVSVTNSSGQEFLQAINYSPNTTSKTINTSFYHNDLYLTSGTYYVTITASDGENEMKAFKEITLIEAPRMLERVFVNQVYDISTRMDSIGGNALVTLYYLPGLYSKGLIDSKYSNYIHTDNTTKNLFVFDMENQMMTLNFLSTPGNAQGSFYNCIAQDAATHNTYIGADNNNVYSIDTGGNIANPITFDNNFSAEHACIDEDYIYFFTRNLQGTQQNMSVYNLSTLSFIQSLAIDINFNVSGIATMEDNNVLVVGTNNGASLFKTYNLNDNVLNNVFTNYHADPCTGVWKDEAGNFYAAHNQKVVKYSSNLNMGSISAAINQLKHVTIENISGTVYAVSPAAIYRLNGSSLSTINSVGTSNCLDVLFKYNK
jgi:hypothetical protein